MKVRILSDIHIDIDAVDNGFYQLQEDDVFTIVAGDVSNSPLLSYWWLKSNIKRGLIIAGNHEFYDSFYDLDQTYQLLAKAMPEQQDLTFLQDSFKVVQDKVFVGCTLWTDFQLNSGGESFFNKKIAQKEISDYKYIKIKGFSGKIRKITPDDTKERFKWSVQYIDKVCKMFPDKEIVVITHHCPSSICLSKNYDFQLNPAYGSRLEPFIDAHPNIKYWICGHSHDGNLIDQIYQCKIIKNCKGYAGRENGNFDENLILDI